MPKFNLNIKPLFIIIGLLLSSALSNGQSIWSVINPSPPWDDYVDVQFVDEQTGYAVGINGNVIKSEDSGTTWFETGSSLVDALLGLYFHDLNNGWIAGSEIYKTSDGGITWEYNFGLNETEFLSIYFSSYQTGYAGNFSGNIYKTTNGGLSWDLNLESNDWITKIYFINDLKGWATTRHNLLITEDGGETWTEINVTGYYVMINDFQFINESTGYVAANGGLLLKTSDGGYSWDTIPLTMGGSDDLLGVHFFDQTNGRVLSEESFYITADGGQSWEQANHPFWYGYASALCFSTENFGCIVGQEIYVTNDGGYNWEHNNVGHTIDQSAICLGNNQDIYVAGDGGIILFSNDNGTSWTEQETPTDEYLTDICHVNENTFWATGHNGTLLSTENGGLSWSLIDLGTHKNLNAVFFPNAQTGCCVGKSSTIYMTHDGGATWNNVSGPPSNHFNDVFFYDDYTGWICGDNGVFMKTVDGGISWLLLNSATTKHLYSLQFTDENKGWLAGWGTIISTNDGGQNCHVQLDELPLPHFNNKIYSINLSDAENGWATGQNGLLLHTNDGGINWVVHNRIITDDLFDIQFRNINEGFAIGVSGYVLYTHQGNYLAPHIINQPGDTILCENSFVSFECYAIGDSLHFQWFYGNEEIPGATENILELESISIYEGGLYSCKIFNGAGSITSDKFMVSIKPNVDVTGHPQDQLVYENDTVIFNLAVSGALPIHYQWQKNGVDISGAIYNIYPIYGVQLSDSAYYRCVVSNDCSVDTTNEAQLAVLPASSIQEMDHEASFSILPNPVKSNCRISFQQKIEKGLYEIYTISGKKIRSEKFSNTNFLDLDLSALLPGIYLIRIESTEMTGSTKFIKD